LLEFKCMPLDSTMNKMKLYKVKCHSYYIVDEAGKSIDWHKPLIQCS